MSLLSRKRAEADPTITASALQASLEAWMCMRGTRAMAKLLDDFKGVTWKNAPQPKALHAVMPLLSCLGP